MNAVLHARALPRKPQQQRAIDRFEAVLHEAQALLAQKGLSEFSIPAVAQRLGYTRASIYKFFPTPYAVLNELIRRHFVGLEQKLAREAAQLVKLPWEDVVRLIVKHAAEYHNAHPVGMMLSLGGAVTDESYRSYQITIQHLGSLSAQLLKARGIDASVVSLDVPALAVDLGTTCFRHGYLRHGRISEDYQNAAAAVMIQFITSQLMGTAARK